MTQKCVQQSHLLLQIWQRRLKLPRTHPDTNYRVEVLSALLANDAVYQRKISRLSSIFQTALDALTNMNRKAQFVHSLPKIQQRLLLYECDGILHGVELLETTSRSFICIPSDPSIIYQKKTIRCKESYDILLIQRTRTNYCSITNVLMESTKYEQHWKQVAMLMDPSSVYHLCDNRENLMLRYLLEGKRTTGTSGVFD